MKPLLVKRRPLSNIVVLVCGLTALFAVCAQGFVPARIPCLDKKVLGRLSPNSVSFSVLRGSDRNDNDSDTNSQAAGDDNSDPDKGQKQVVGHLGGRRRRSETKSKRSKDGALLGRLSKWSWTAIPLLAVLFFLKSLFGSSNDNPNFVYYESSMFESRVYNGNGRVDVRRKESVRSNVPSLLEGKRLMQQKELKQLPLHSPSSYMLQPSPDKDFERELQSLMRDFQRTIYSDFY